eukprot:TRINITY_DN8275_c0_g2_i1.p1 TRINITY_DN8275_c0_g2~~TRINITY_DN8275_c0_g2_i1.p1  ORF type:complete len:138 (-),score=27.49 TRINITY_DN8275_c0_g2_i1:19-432(-)
MTQLETLIIQENSNIRSIPGSIRKLVGLKHLSLQKNQIESLTPAFGLLTNLVSLDLAGNSLVILPHEMTLLTNLMFLNISENKDLSVNPAVIGKMEGLVGLSMAQTRLTSEVWSEKCFSVKPDLTVEFFKIQAYLYD